jgi:hypothetical protein
MTDTKHAYARQYHGRQPAAQSLVLPFGVSLLFHLVIIGALIFMPDFGSGPRFRSGVVNVSLVSLPSAGPPAGGPAPAPAKPQPVVKKPPEKPAVKIPEPKAVPVVKKTAQSRITGAQKGKAEKVAKEKDA